MPCARGSGARRREVEREEELVGARAPGLRVEVEVLQGLHEEEGARGRAPAAEGRPDVVAPRLELQGLRRAVLEHVDDAAAAQAQGTFRAEAGRGEARQGEEAPRRAQPHVHELE